MTKHTPGPYIIKTSPAGEYEINYKGEDPENYEGECDDIFVMTQNGLTIAKVYNPDAQFIQHGEMVNAYLLSAAPDMLKALENIKSDLLDAGLKVPRYLKNAISKARGGIMKLNPNNLDIFMSQLQAEIQYDGGIKHVCRRTEIVRSTMERMFTDNAMPTLCSVVDVLEALGYHLELKRGEDVDGA